MRSSRNVAVEADLRGRIVIGHLPDPFARIPLAEYSEKATNLESFLRRSSGIPLAYIHVSTPLDCDFRWNDSHPKCYAWTLFKCINPKRSDPSEKIDVRKMVSGLGAYGLTFKSFQPDHPFDIDKAVEFLATSPKWLTVLRLGRSHLCEREAEYARVAEEWAETQVVLLTDFDGLVPRLSGTQFTLNQRLSQER